MNENLTQLQDIATEESVIAHVIAIPDTFDEVNTRLSADSFSSPACNLIWRAICYLRNQGRTPDRLFLKSYFSSRQKLAQSLGELERIANSELSRNVIQQCDVLEDRRKRRVYHDLYIQLAENEGAPQEVLDSIVQSAIEQRDKHTACSVLDKAGLMNHAANVIRTNLDPNKANREIYTGFRIIDEAGGLPPETEVIVAAFSSQGKTSFALTVMDNAIRNNVDCALYSAEMGASSIAGRILNMRGWNVPITKFKTQALLDDTIRDFNRISSDFIQEGGELYVDVSSNHDVDYICSSIKVLHRTKGVKFAIVDYLQIVAMFGEKGDSDQERLATASRKFQAVAKQLNICIMVLSQFSRPMRDQGHQPSEDLIRGSGQIYEACDIALYVYRPEKWDKESYPYPFEDAEKRDTAMIKIGKYRDGEANRSAIVGFDGPRTLFYEFEEGRYDQDPAKNYPKRCDIPPQETNKPF